MSAMPDGYRVPAIRASDADRDAVISALSEHFQAGRLTTEELEERTGQALAARTLGELDELTADLPGPRIAQPSPSAQQAQPLAPRPGLLAYRAPVPTIAIVAALVIVAVAVGGRVGHHGLLWLLVPAFIIARARGLRRRSSRRSRWY